ncbi:MAG: hypothetical protein EZS28_025268 [Streblomastix strix]|uniref:Uncharacterized protein n=1 Tax=Streblomastix strix TaxID=222440 RepID=A0A5J4VA42_9EUKA|nr:MAG: hypothetical protein EZS28_025268 [Streblomastix strix]
MNQIEFNVEKERKLEERERKQELRRKKIAEVVERRRKEKEEEEREKEMELEKNETKIKTEVKDNNEDKNMIDQDSEMNKDQIKQKNEPIRRKVDIATLLGMKSSSAVKRKREEKEVKLNDINQDQKIEKKNQTQEKEDQIKGNNEKGQEEDQRRLVPDDMDGNYNEVIENQRETQTSNISQQQENLQQQYHNPQLPFIVATAIASHPIFPDLIIVGARIGEDGKKSGLFLLEIK